MMNSSGPLPLCNADTSLWVCDATGKVKGVASRARGSSADAGETSVGQTVCLSSKVNRWLLDRIQEAGDRGDFSAEAELDLEDGSGQVLVRVDRLTCEAGLFGFALQLLSNERLLRNNVGEGDSIISRRQWHEIKNHIGALRLYATFLTRRMPEGDEKQIVDKLLSGINSLIAYLDKIRRGDPQ